MKWAKWEKSRTTAWKISVLSSKKFSEVYFIRKIIHRIKYCSYLANWPIVYMLTWMSIGQPLPMTDLDLLTLTFCTGRLPGFITGLSPNKHFYSCLSTASWWSFSSSVKYRGFYGVIVSLCFAVRRFWIISLHLKLVLGRPQKLS